MPTRYNDRDCSDPTIFGFPYRPELTRSRTASARHSSNIMPGLFLPTSSEHAVQRQAVALFCQLRRDRCLLGCVKRALGVEHV